MVDACVGDWLIYLDSWLMVESMSRVYRIYRCIDLKKTISGYLFYDLNVYCVKL